MRMMNIAVIGAGVAGLCAGKCETTNLFWKDLFVGC